MNARKKMKIIPRAKKNKENDMKKVIKVKVFGRKKYKGKCGKMTKRKNETKEKTKKKKKRKKKGKKE